MGSAKWWIGNSDHDPLDKSINVVPTPEQALSEMSARMEQLVSYWHDGMEDTLRKRAFSLGRMIELEAAADKLMPGQNVVSTPGWWQSECDKLNV